MLTSLAALEFDHNLPEAQRLLRESLKTMRALGDKLAITNLLLQLAVISITLGDYAASRAGSEEALSIAREIGYRRFIARSLTNLGEVALAEQDLAAARSYVDEALAIWPEVGHMSGLADATLLSGMVALQEKDYEMASRSIDESLELARSLGAAPRTANALYAFGELERAREDFDAAEQRYLEALRISWKIGSLAGAGRREAQISGAAESLLGLGLVAARRGEAARAARLFAAAESSKPKGSTLLPSSRLDYEEAVAKARRALGEEKFASEWAKGKAASHAEVMDIAGRQ